MYVVVKVVENTGRIIGSYIGFFERVRENVAPMKPGELRDRLRDGRRFLELDTRLGTLKKWLADLQQVKHPNNRHLRPKL